MESFNLHPKYWSKNQYALNPVKINKITYQQNDIPQEEEEEQYGIKLFDILTITLSKLNRLTELKIIGSNISRLPDCLPETLIYLYLSNNHLESLPNILPCTLETIYISNNQIRDLTPIGQNYLPNLNILIANNNPGLQFPTNGLPSSINILDISKCGLKTLGPNKLPSKLIHLNCNSNFLKYLPEPLPSGLELLNCSYNQIEYLPIIPPKLSIIEANHNNLQFLDIDILNKLDVVNHKKIKINFHDNPELPNYETKNRYADVHEIFNIKDIENSDLNYHKTNMAKARYRLKIIGEELRIKYHDMCFSPSRVSRLIECGEMDINHTIEW